MTDAELQEVADHVREMDELNERRAMSVSEKLAVLETTYGADFKSKRGQYLAASLLDALPQIRALVKAAEVMTTPDGVVRQGDMNFIRLTPAEVLGPALTALDKALP